MELNEVIQTVKKELSLPRFEHTMRVTETAERLALRYAAPVEIVKLAAILHDYAKERPINELKKLVTDSDLPLHFLEFNTELLHAPVGAILVKQELRIEDQEILNAISSHTTGKKKMTKVEKIVFLADYIEPGRQFPGLEEVRNQAEKNLDLACWLVSRNTIHYLLTKQAKIHPDSIDAYNDLTEIINEVKY